MEHCLLGSAKTSCLDVCAPCRHRVATVVRNELPRTPLRLARILGDELEEITDHVLDATLRTAAQGTIESATLAAFVYRCAKNRIVDRIRFWQADCRTIDREIDATRGREALAGVKDPTRPGPGVATRLDNADRILLLKSLLAHHDGPEAVAVRLKYLSGEDPSWKELSEKVGFGPDGGDRLRMRVGTLLNQLHRDMARIQ